MTEINQYQYRSIRSHGNQRINILTAPTLEVMTLLMWKSVIRTGQEGVVGWWVHFLKCTQTHMHDVCTQTQTQTQTHMYEGQ